MLTNILDMVKSQFTKNEKSFVVGGVMSITQSVTQWLTSDKFMIEHWVLLGILVAVLLIDHQAGSKLAKKSKIKNKSSKVLTESFIRDFIIIAICLIAKAIDFLLGTGAAFFTLFTGAFIYTNFYSFVGNIGVLGWSDKFPIWLFDWVKDEMILKAKKYFDSTGGKK